MQVRHGLTSHGFAINITNEPIAWFNQVVACGLEDVKAASVQSVREELNGKSPSLEVPTEMRVLAELFGDRYGKEARPLEKEDGEVWEFVKEIEGAAKEAGEWPRKPVRSVV